MFKRLSVLLVLLLVFGVLLVQAQGNDGAGDAESTLFAQGQELFEANCSVCHQSSGGGRPPAIPALAGNENLQDVALIVTTVHEGRDGMPAFPQFDSEELSAIATYVRNAWENDFGEVSTDDVEEHLASLEAAREAAGEDAGGAGTEEGGESAQQRSVWDGVYTSAQAERGSSLYSSSCSVCHGYVWMGQRNWDAPSIRSRAKSHLMLVSDPTLGPVLHGQPFLSKWNGQSVAALYVLTSSTMPLDDPGALSDQQYIDIIAFLFAASNIPAGEEELPPERETLNDIVIQAEPPQ